MEINDIVFDHIELVRQTFDDQFNKLIIDVSDRIGDTFEPGDIEMLFNNGCIAAYLQPIFKRSIT